MMSVYIIIIVQRKIVVCLMCNDVYNTSFIGDSNLCHGPHSFNNCFCFVWQQKVQCSLLIKQVSCVIIISNYRFHQEVLDEIKDFMGFKLKPDDNNHKSPKKVTDKKNE